LLHQQHLEQSENCSETTTSDGADCYTNLLHHPSERLPSPSSRLPHRRRANPPGLIVRGRVFHVRVKVPRKAQATVGRTQVWRSLGTGNRSDAIRKSKLIIADLERSFWSAAGTPTREATVADIVLPKPVMVEAAPISAMTFSDLFRHFQADPSKVRAPKTQMIYDGLLWITSSVWGENRLLTSIDRSACRELLEVLRWFPCSRSSASVFRPPKPHPTPFRTSSSGRRRMDGPMRQIDLAMPSTREGGSLRHLSDRRGSRKSPFSGRRHLLNQRWQQTPRRGRLSAPPQTIGTLPRRSVVPPSD